MYRQESWQLIPDVACHDWISIRCADLCFKMNPYRSASTGEILYSRYLE